MFTFAFDRFVIKRLFGTVGTRILKKKMYTNLCEKRKPNDHGEKNKRVCLRVEMEEELNLHGFDVFDEKSDVTITVEGTKLYLNKGILSYASPVFDKMFHSGLKKKSLDEISLPGKTCDNFVAFLLCIYPNTMAEISESNIEKILPLADEYQVETLKERCDKFISESLYNDVQQVGERSTNKHLVHSLVLAEKFNLAEAMEKAIKLAAVRRFVNLKKEMEFGEITDKTKVKLLSRQMEIIDYYASVTGTGIVKLSRAIPKEQYDINSEGKLKEKCPFPSITLRKGVKDKLEILWSSNSKVEALFKMFEIN